MNSMRSQLKVMKSGASIVNAASAAGLHGMPGAAAYCASKVSIRGQHFGPNQIGSKLAASDIC